MSDMANRNWRRGYEQAQLDRAAGRGYCPQWRSQQYREGYEDGWNESAR